MTSEIKGMASPMPGPQPHLVDKDGDGIAEMVYRTIQDCAIDLRMEVWGPGRVTGWGWPRQVGRMREHPPPSLVRGHTKVL